MDKLLRIDIRVDEAEKAGIKQRADAAGLSVSEYVRMTVLGSRPRAKKAEAKAADPALLAGINRIGNNLNQMARIANAQGDLPSIVALASIGDQLKELIPNVDQS